MKPATPLLFSLALSCPLLGLVTSALAQVQTQVQAQDQALVPAGPAAAARLPNTFGDPAAGRRVSSTQTQTRGPVQAQGPVQTQGPVQAEPTAADRARAEVAEAMLTTTIAAFQAGTPNYGDMSDDLAAKVRENAAVITPLIQGFGKVQSMAHVGVENGADLFLVGFERQITQWIIAQTPEGKIIALLFRPANPATGG